MDLTTPRLRLRMLEASEAELVAAFWTRNRAHLEPWVPAQPEEDFTADYWEKRLIAYAAENAAATHVRRFVLEGERVIGAVNLNNVVRGFFHSAYLGFSLDHAAEGQGKMHEALVAVVAHAFSKDGLHLHRIEANHQPHNARSAALLGRLGFERQGFAKDYLFINGAWRDHVMTALINREW